jgi:signal transduction histidine kinase
MELNRRRNVVFALLAGVWLLLAGWQVQEHRRVVESARSDLRNRSHEIASTLSAVTRALRFRGAIFQERLDPVLNELVSPHTNALLKPSGLMALALLNIDGEAVVSVGDTNLLFREITVERETWSADHVTFVLPMAGANVGPEGVTNNPTVVLPAFRDLTNEPPRGRDFQRREPRSDETNPPPPATNALGEIQAPPPPPPGEGERHDRPRGGRRPPWMRGMTDEEFKALAARRELHGLVLVMSTENFVATCRHDWWLRGIIGFFAAVSALGAGLVWRNLGKTAELQIRLVRASEQNAHLRELNLAAAGLAHETRNPLNIIRGQAQMISRQPGVAPDVQEQSRLIVSETDKVTAQLTEFINYARPREVRRARVAPLTVAGEVVRTLAYDIEEKILKVETSGDALTVEADEQLLRQVIFNLLLNSIQAVGENGKIQVALRRSDKNEAVFEVRDDGPGVSPEKRLEIFKPYVTTNQKGTGLGLAVVQQIVHAHGWEIECLPNDPRGAIFRISHLKICP